MFQQQPQIYEQPQLYASGELVQTWPDPTQQEGVFLNPYLPKPASKSSGNWRNLMLGVLLFSVAAAGLYMAKQKGLIGPKRKPPMLPHAGYVDFKNLWDVIRSDVKENIRKTYIPSVDKVDEVLPAVGKYVSAVRQLPDPTTEQERAVYKLKFELVKTLTSVLYTRCSVVARACKDARKEVGFPLLGVQAKELPKDTDLRGGKKTLGLLKESIEDYFDFQIPAGKEQEEAPAELVDRLIKKLTVMMEFRADESKLMTEALKPLETLVKDMETVPGMVFVVEIPGEDGAKVDVKRLLEMYKTLQHTRDPLFDADFLKKLFEDWSSEGIKGFLNELEAYETEVYRNEREAINEIKLDLTPATDQVPDFVKLLVDAL